MVLGGDIISRVDIRLVAEIGAGIIFHSHTKKRSDMKSPDLLQAKIVDIKILRYQAHMTRF